VQRPVGVAAADPDLLAAVVRRAQAGAREPLPRRRRQERLAGRVDGLDAVRLQIAAEDSRFLLGTDLRQLDDVVVAQ
jgi:hypothetical protein